MKNKLFERRYEMHEYSPESQNYLMVGVSTERDLPKFCKMYHSLFNDKIFALDPNEYILYLVETYEDDPVRNILGTWSGKDLFDFTEAHSQR